MPLINYKNDDKIIFSKKQCECGITSRVIEEIKGRVDDYVVRPDGSKISQYIFYYIFKEVNDIGFEQSVKKYKIIQTGNSFNIYI